MTRSTYITQEGLKKLKEELEFLMNIERPKISKQIGEAIEKGDITENAEYDAAKDAQGLLEAKIAGLQNKIAHARIIDETKIDTSQVQILNKVTIRNQTNNATMQYTKGLGMTLIDWHFGTDEIGADFKDTDAEQAGQAALEALLHLGRVGIATPYAHRITHFRQLRRQSLAWNGHSRQG